MGNELTIKQEKYAQGLFAGLTQREAYKQSYDCGNMTDKSCDEKACELAANVKVVSRINDLKNEYKLRNMATVDKVLAEYAKIAFADIKDFLKFGTEKVVDSYDEEGRPVYVYKQVVDAKSSDEVDGTLIQEVSIGKDGTFKFKLYDKKGALDMIGKHLGMFTERIEHTGLNGGPIEVSNRMDLSRLSSEELQLMLDIMEKGQITGEVVDI